MRRWASLLAVSLLAAPARASLLPVCQKAAGAAQDALTNPDMKMMEVNAVVQNAVVICNSGILTNANLIKDPNVTFEQKQEYYREGSALVTELKKVYDERNGGMPLTDGVKTSLVNAFNNGIEAFKEPPKAPDKNEALATGITGLATGMNNVRTGTEKSSGKLQGGKADDFRFKPGGGTRDDKGQTVQPTTEENEQLLDQGGDGRAPTSQDYTKVAEDYVKNDRPADARRAADKAVQRNPEDPVALASRARIRAQAGDTQGAVADAREALKRDPNNELAKFIVGNRDQLARSGSKLKALKLDFGAAREADELSGGAGGGFRQYGGEGFAAKTVAFTQFPVNPAAQKFLESAKIKLGVGDRTGALMDATRAVGADAGSPVPLLLRARITREMGNPQGALDDAQRALALAPEDANALRERALAFMDLGRYSEALADLERAMKLDPNNGVAYLYRAMVYEKLGRPSEALEDLATAVRLEPALKPLADEVAARLKAPSPQTKRVDQLSRKMVRLGAIGASLLLILIGLLSSAKGRAIVTTTAKTLFGSSSAPTVADVPQVPDLPAGAVLGGLYRIERELGRGGMGVVYEATDTGLQRRVAIKRLQRDARTTQADFDRFLNEARTVAKLRHPRVAEIHNLLVDGDLYLVFEYLEGETLDRALEKRLRLPLPDAKRVIGDVAAAIGFAHQQKVIHRDLKPSNVMVETSGAAKVMDFGIAHQANSAATVLTRTSASGTPPYMAPEQAMGSVSKASDLYALAVMAYELVVGRRPFEGPDFLEQKLGRAFLPPSEIAPGLPKGLDAFFQRALDPDPTKRHASAEDFVKAFEGACV